MMNQLDITQPDQFNPNGKIKYVTNPKQFEQPLFKYYQDLDSTDSKTTYTRNVNVEFNRTLDSNFTNKFFPQFASNTKGHPADYAKKIDIENKFKIPFNTNGRTIEMIHDRRRNLDYSNYIPAGSMTNAGFGNINDFSKIKYGEFTRDINGPARDKEIDRFHFTHRNYQHEVYGSNPLPKDTRYLNKKF